MKYLLREDILKEWKNSGLSHCYKNINKADLGSSLYSSKITVVCMVGDEKLQFSYVDTFYMIEQIKSDIASVRAKIREHKITSILEK